MKKYILILLFFPIILFAAPVTINFDSGTLEGYTGVSFQNLGMWNAGGSPSVLVNPDGGAVSLPYGIYNTNWQYTPGIVNFAFDIDMISIYSLSGPGNDNLIAGTKVRAYNASNVLLAEVNVNTTIQFELLTINAAGIRKLELIVGGNHDVWDDLTYNIQVPEASTFFYIAFFAVVFLTKWKKFL